MKTKFNLATAPLENNRRFITGSALLGILAIAAMAFLSLHAVRVRRANREMRTDIDRLQAQIRVSQREQESLRDSFKSPQAVEALKRSQFLNGLIEERTFPWTKMFADLERILPAGVRVISISPQMDKDGKLKVALRVGAVSYDQGIKFLDSIDSSHAFSDVQVAEGSQSPKASEGSADKVQMTLEARYSSW